VYRKLSFEVVSLPLQVEAVTDKMWDGPTPSVVHISAPIGESLTPREVFLVTGEGKEPIRIEVLAHAFSRWPEDQLRPFVILDTVDNPFDRGRTLLLRNAFAARLFPEATRGVLAIGPYAREDLAAAVQALIAHMTGHISISELHSSFWEAQRNPAPALFTLDPDLPLWD